MKDELVLQRHLHFHTSVSNLKESGSGSSVPLQKQIIHTGKKKKYKACYFIQRPDSCRLSGWYREAWLGTYLHNTGVWPGLSPVSSLPVGKGR